MMTIEISDLRFACIVGLLDFERTAPQTVAIDLRIGYRYAHGRYLDYAQVCERVKRIMTESKFEVLEEAVLSVARQLKHDFPAVETLELSIAKPDILPDCSVRVTKVFNY